MPAMTKKNVQLSVGNEENLIADDLLTPDEIELLSPKEIELERKAKLEELKKRDWMAHSAEQLTSRIPVSVFAMGSLAGAG
jgi:hypothetical protein